MTSIDDRARQLAEQLPSGNVDSARATVLDAEHRRLRTALAEAGQRAAQAERARSAALARIGGIIAEGRDLRDAYGRAMPRLKLTDAEELTGMSRPTLYAAIDRVPAEDDDDPATWADQRLAAGVLDLALSNREKIEDEFRVRYPAIMALADAATIVTRAAGDRDELDEGNWLDAPPAADDLMQAWKDRVRAVAEGRAEPPCAVPGEPGMW